MIIVSSIAGTISRDDAGHGLAGNIDRLEHPAASAHLGVRVRHSVARSPTHRALGADDEAAQIIARRPRPRRPARRPRRRQHELEAEHVVGGYPYLTCADRRNSRRRCRRSCTRTGSTDRARRRGGARRRRATPRFTTPASTTARRLARSMETMRVSRLVQIITGVPSGRQPPDKPLPAPRRERHAVAMEQARRRDLLQRARRHHHLEDPSFEVHPSHSHPRRRARSPRRTDQIRQSLHHLRRGIVLRNHRWTQMAAKASVAICVHLWFLCDAVRRALSCAPRTRAVAFIRAC